MRVARMALEDGIACGLARRVMGLSVLAMRVTGVNLR